MKAEIKVFNDLIETIVVNSENNTAKITDVKSWAEAWRKEMSLPIDESQAEQKLFGLCVVNHRRELLLDFLRWQSKAYSCSNDDACNAKEVEAFFKSNNCYQLPIKRIKPNQKAMVQNENDLNLTVKGTDKVVTNKNKSEFYNLKTKI